MKMEYFEDFPVSKKCQTTICHWKAPGQDLTISKIAEPKSDHSKKCRVKIAQFRKLPNTDEQFWQLLSYQDFIISKIVKSKFYSF